MRWRAALDLAVRRLLRRVVETAPQARRSGAERRLALAGAFQPGAAPPAAVVLVDDVLTTGDRGRGVRGRSVRAGAVEVGVLAAARSLGGPPSGPLLYSGRASARVCGCPGDDPPVVDASRRRNDPRKATIGR